MLAPPEGSAPPQRSANPWTRADVERWLKAAFRAMPFTPIFAPRGNTLQAAAGDVPDATFDIVAFSGTVLGDKSEDRQVVLLWGAGDGHARRGRRIDRRVLPAHPMVPRNLRPPPH